MEPAVCFFVLFWGVFFHRLHSLFLSLFICKHCAYDYAFHWRAITPSWLVGWLCLPLSLFLAGMHAPFWFPTLLFNGVTKIILGGWRSDEVGHWREGRDVG